MKFEDKKLKYNIQRNHKNLPQKSLDLTKLKFSGKLFISESVCSKNQCLAFKCQQPKNSKKINSTFFEINVVNIMITCNGEIHQMFHATGMEKLLGIENLEDFISNTSFYINNIVLFFQ